VNKEVNKEVQKYINIKKNSMEHYKIGGFLPDYNNPNKPYSNPYRKHPKSFIPDYRQPIDGIVPDDYSSTLDKENRMYEEHMDQQTEYTDLLNSS